ncbi:ABC transporter ATP-binding protein [Pseudonocardia kongjuensis]|uniref:Spermidine/putrescine import ATP-binding protein PotA n=1 Tax=Pseudonocardia kongjuensis TaxID=102227 RepID=A0ABP4I433_9PSEU
MTRTDVRPGDPAATAATSGEDGTAPGGAAVRLDGIVKEYGAFRAVDDVSLTIAAGEFVTLLGASGSGKTTLLRILAGFVPATLGGIRIDGQEISGVPVHRRHIGMVFQDYALFPHLSVERNVAFPLRMQRTPRAERRARVAEALDMVQLGHLGRRLPKELSGGQQQRVALARAIVARPRLLLMDEPLGALDRRLRESMQIEIRRISRELGLTVVNVTHDQEEAMSMSDRIAMLAEGRLVQYGAPEDLYRRPVNDVAASFLGESNLFRGTVTEQQGRLCLPDAGGHVLLPTGPGWWRPGASAVVMVRPQSVTVRSRDADRPPPHRSSVPGTVAATVYAGDSWRILVHDAGGRELVVRAGPDVPHDFAIGDEVTLDWDPAHSVVMAAAS